MARLVRYKPSRKGIKALLGSDDVAADLHRRAENVAEVARASYAASPPHEGEVRVIVDSQTAGKRTKGRRSRNRKTRARAAVIANHAAAQFIEADRRPLGSAIDAAAH